MKVSIKKRSGEDLFYYLDLVEESQDRANEWAITEFVQFDGQAANLKKFLELSGERQAILTGRVFSLNVKGVRQNDDYLTYGESKFSRKLVPHNVVEKLQLKMQRLKERGETSTTSMIRSSIELFYDVELNVLEKLDYKITAFMFNYINAFLTRITEPSDEFDFDD
jgi:predicted GTPase